MYMFLGSYYVIQALTQNIKQLQELAYNIYWADGKNR